MELAQKLQLKPGQRVCVQDAPPELSDVLALHDPGSSVADALVTFVVRASELTASSEVLEAARADRLAWIAYPKGGKLGTDLNRDSLAALATSFGVRPVRQVSLDATWSALRFRPA